jgi:hypothetical protein
MVHQAKSNQLPSNKTHKTRLDGFVKPAEGFTSFPIGYFTGFTNRSYPHLGKAHWVAKSGSQLGL